MTSALDTARAQAKNELAGAMAMQFDAPEAPTSFSIPANQHSKWRETDITLFSLPHDRNGHIITNAKIAGQTLTPPQLDTLMHLSTSGRYNAYATLAAGANLTPEQMNQLDATSQQTGTMTTMNTSEKTQTRSR